MTNAQRGLTLYEAPTYTGLVDDDKPALRKERGVDEDFSTPIDPSPAWLDWDGYPRIVGERWMAIQRGVGKRDVEIIPLTEEDLLNPREGDVVSEGMLHRFLVDRLWRCLRSWFAARRTDTGVYSNLNIRWPLDPHKAPAPDVAVVQGVRHPQRLRDSFDTVAEGAAPCFVIEVTSESTRRVDFTRKIDFYCRAGVEEYLIVDTQDWRRGKGALSLCGFRLSGGRYRQIEPDVRGRLPFRCVGLTFETAPKGGEVVIKDAGTGEIVLTDEENRAQAAEERIRELEAELARLRARRHGL